MTKFVTSVKKMFTRQEEGATMAEYALLLALIAIVVIVAVKLVGTNMSTLFSNIAGSI